MDSKQLVAEIMKGDIESFKKGFSELLAKRIEEKMSSLRADAIADMGLEVFEKDEEVEPELNDGQELLTEPEEDMPMGEVEAEAEEGEEAPVEEPTEAEVEVQADEATEGEEEVVEPEVEAEAEPSSDEEEAELIRVELELSDEEDK